jgi:hypothetical protein
LQCKYAPSESPLLQASNPITVSELRFNLPATSPTGARSPTATTPPAPTIPPTTTTPDPATDPTTDDRGGRRSRFFRRFKQKLEALANSPANGRRGSEPIISTTRLDLSLGLELAGGGFAGHNAKMGKLIVESEGMKMLDLLIAANLSLWWKAYEKR